MNDFENKRPLSEEDMKKIQRKSVIENDESHDDAEIPIRTEKPKSVVEEKIEPTPPKDYGKKKDDDIMTDIDKRYAISMDETEDKLDDDSDSISSYPEYRDTEPATRVADGKDKPDSEKEFLNREKTIYSDDRLPVKAPKKKQQVAEYHPPKKPDNVKSKLAGVGMAFAILASTILMVLLVVSLLNKPTLSDTERDVIVEMSRFLSYNEKYVNGINELSDQKRLLLESYIKGTRDNKELALELIAINKKEKQISQKYADYTWNYKQTKQAYDMTGEFIGNNLNTSETLIKLLGDKVNKGQMVTTFNDMTKTNSSYIYTLNEYVKNQVQQFGVSTAVEGNAIQINLSQIK